MWVRRCMPTKGLFSRLGDLALLERFSISLSLNLFSRACIRIPPLLVPIYFSCSLPGPRSLGMAMPILHFLLCVIALCMMCVYIYIYLRVCGWLCTLYDGLSWLHEWPSLVINALDLVVWVCAQGDCRRCIFMLYCVHNHCSVIVLIYVTKWHWFPRICNMHQHA